MSNPKLVSRKELATLISRWRGHNVTVNQVRDNETIWGIKNTRRDLNARVVLYDEALAIAGLKQNGIIPL